MGPNKGPIPSWWLSFNPFETYATVKLDHLPSLFGVKIPSKYLSWIIHPDTRDPNPTPIFESLKIWEWYGSRLP